MEGILEEPRAVLAVLVLGIVCLLVAWAILRPALEASPAVEALRNVSAHAVQRHGEQAVLAAKWVADHASPFNRWDCRDGRTRYVVPRPDHTWAVSVWEGAINITAFITGDQAYVKHMLEDCDQFMRFAHP